jgi:hypothetical protein
MGFNSAFKWLNSFKILTIKELITIRSADSGFPWQQIQVIIYLKIRRIFLAGVE